MSSVSSRCDHEILSIFKSNLCVSYMINYYYILLPDIMCLGLPPLVDSVSARSIISNGVWSCIQFNALGIQIAWKFLHRSNQIFVISAVHFITIFVSLRLTNFCIIYCLVCQYLIK